MTEEEKEAIENLTNLLSQRNEKQVKITTYDLFGDIKTVLNLIQKQEKTINKLKRHNKELLRKLRNRVKEVKKLTKYSFYKKEFATLNKKLKEKNKQIDLMAQCIDIELSSLRLSIILNKNVKPLESYKDEIKQYFEKKAEQEKGDKDE